MNNFYKFWDKINGEMYKDIEPPVKYEFAKYIDSITNGSVNGTEDGTYELRPLTVDDMARYSAEDTVEYYKKHGKNSTKLGNQMTDDELKKHYGQTW